MPLTGDERWELALRVAASPEFSRSARLHDFLLYVCEKALSNSADEIHEQQIGSAVFGRKLNYNCNEDNIVRVEARELRKRLDRYFAGAGKTEKLRIRIPKGSYVPSFEPQVSPELEDKGAALGGGEKTGEKGERVKTPVLGRWSLGIILTLSLLVIILLVANFRNRVRIGNPEPSRTTLNSSVNVGNIWPLLFNSQRPTNIVVSDCPLLAVENKTGKAISLKQYMERRYISELNSSSVAGVAPDEWTSLADAIIIAKLVKAVASYPATIRVRYPRDLAVRDLEGSNLVFLGSSYSDPWITEFDAERNFVVRLVPSRATLGYENRSPLPGEQARYDAFGMGGKSDVTYGLVTFLPNLHQDGNVLILEGTTTEGTEAAGDFMTDPGLASRLRKDLNLKSGEPVPYFQLLLRTTMLGGAATKMEVVAHRIISVP